MTRRGFVENEKERVYPAGSRILRGAVLLYYSRRFDVMQQPVWLGPKAKTPGAAASEIPTSAIGLDRPWQQPKAR